MHILRKTYDFICRIEHTLSMMTMVGTTLLIFVAAVLRSLNWPLNAALEISQFLFAWCVFLSADVALREDRLIRLDMLTSKLPKKIELSLLILSYLIILAFLVAMAYYGYILTYRTRVRSFLGMPNFSYAWVTLSLPFASTLMTITTILKLRDFFRQLLPPAATVEKVPLQKNAGGTEKLQDNL
ncbi:MAG: TRAP transporter small permease subunit [Planctomycetes bacterium]|nr:TRAP transporter small permease subunit [Planctomycetota bacterium]